MDDETSADTGSEDTDYRELAHAEAEQELAAPPASPAPPDAVHLDVEIGDDGEGQGFVGMDVDRVALWNPPADCSVGVMAAHTVGISRVLVSGAKPGSTVHVVVLPK